MSKEANPNLLKNLVATLRIWVKFPVPKNNCLGKLWQHFLKAKKVNHRLIKFVFGSTDGLTGCLAADIKNLFLEDVDPTEFFSAQAVIREETIRQLE